MSEEGDSEGGGMDEDVASEVDRLGDIFTEVVVDCKVGWQIIKIPSKNCVLRVVCLCTKSSSPPPPNYPPTLSPPSRHSDPG